MAQFVFLVLLNLFAFSVRDRIKATGMQSLFVVFFGVNMIVYFGGAVDLLRPVTLVCYMVMLLSGIFYIARCRTLTDRMREYFDLPVVMVNLSAVVFGFIYGTGGYMAYYWDEYSFWSVSAKFTKYYDMFHSVAHSAVQFWQLPPVNGSMYYLSDFLAKDFRDYSLLYAYAIMYFICFGMMADYVRKKTSNDILMLVFYVFLLLSPFAAIYHLPDARYTTLLYAYGTSMVDFNIPVVFGGVIAGYLSSREKPLFVPAIMFLALIKNTSIFFALLAALVICAFELFSNAKSPRKRAIAIVFTLLFPVISYASWNLHTAVFLNYTPATSGYDLREEIPQGMEPEEALPEETENTTLLSVFVPGLRTPRHEQVVQEMFAQIKTLQITAFSKDSLLLAALLAMGILSACLTKEDKLGVLSTSLGLFAGVFVYTLVICYFISFFGDGMVEYQRYMSSYYWAYLYTALLLLVPLIGIRSKIAAQVFVCVLLFFPVRILLDFGLDKTVIDFPQNPFVQAIEAEKVLEPYRDVLTKDTYLYLALPDMDTWGYFLYIQRALPAVSGVGRGLPDIDFTISFREHYDYENRLYHYNIADAATYAEIMNRYFDYILIVDPDWEYIAGYDSLFEGGIKKGQLYRVTEDAVPMKVVTGNG